MNTTANKSIELVIALVMLDRLFQAADAEDPHVHAAVGSSKEVWEEHAQCGNERDSQPVRNKKEERL
jgi:hypothetical protein